MIPLHRPSVARHSRAIAALAALVVLAPVAVAPPAAAQLGFTEFALTDSSLNSSPPTDFWIASAAPADVDQDGDLDLLIAGYFVVYTTPTEPGSVEERLTLYRNDGPLGDSAWVLTPLAVDAAGLSFGSADLAWADYDQDGDPDVVVASDGATTLYRNDGGMLVRTPTVLPAYREDSDFSTMDLSSLTWGDFDNDGDPDLILPSVVEGFAYGPVRLLRNDGAGPGDEWLFTDTGAALPPAGNGVSARGDLDGDGDLDLMLGNVSPWGDNFLATFRNDGGTFTQADSGLAFIRYGMADWGDADGDGDLDVVYCGNIDLPDGTGETVVRILFNDGVGGYVPVTVLNDFHSPQEPWLDFSAVTWADYDSDGDVDLLVSGEWLGDGEIVGRAMVYGNDGGAFAPASGPLPAPIAGNAGGAFTWFDIDGDGDLDYFVAGGYYVEGGNGLIEARTQLLRNDAPGRNQTPSAPTADAGAAAADGSSHTVVWGPASDDRTPAPALTYHLEVVPLGGSTGNGRAIPQPGNVGHNTSWPLRGLAPGTYLWSVRALDSAFNDGPPLTGQITVLPVAAEPAASGGALFLSAPVPNPAREGTRVHLALARDADVIVDLYDARGRRVERVFAGRLAAGRHDLRVARDGLAPGLYFLRATADGESVGRTVTVAP